MLRPWVFPTPDLGGWALNPGHCFPILACLTVVREKHSSLMTLLFYPIPSGPKVLDIKIKWDSKPFLLHLQPSQAEVFVCSLVVGKLKSNFIFIFKVWFEGLMWEIRWSWMESNWVTTYIWFILKEWWRKKSQQCPIVVLAHYLYLFVKKSFLVLNLPLHIIGDM